MDKCDYCGSRIFFGGVRQDGRRFCNNKCYQEGYLLPMSNEVPADVVQQQIDTVHQGNCPKCRGRGPVDVHTSYKVYSLIYITRWSSMPQISCQSCGRNKQLLMAGFCLLFGWWGIPSGLILTPVQITRNLMGVFSPPDPRRPSALLEKLIRLHVARQVLANSQAKRPLA